MKTKTKKEIVEKEFDTVETFRKIKEKISTEIADMNLDQLKDYLKAKKARIQN